MSRKHVENDAHYKMCKKIAQLTKVVYQLNTRNEDNDARVAELRRRHEAELRTVCSEAERRLEEMQRAFHEEGEKRNSMLESVERRCSAQLREAKDAFTQRIATMVNELSASKARFEEVAAEVKARATEEVAKVSSVKDEEMANLVREYNERYKSMLAEQMDARDALEKQVNTLQSELDAASAAHASKLEEWEKRLDEANDHTARAMAETAQWKENHSCKEAEVNRLREECEALRSRLDGEKDSLGILRDIESALREETNELKNLLKRVEEERDEFERGLTEKTMLLAKAMSDITNLENEKSLIETQQEYHSHEIREAAKKNEELMSQVTSLERRIVELGEAAEVAKQEIERHIQTERSLEKSCDELKQQIAELVVKHQDELAALQASHQAALSEMHSASQKSNDVLLVQRQREEKELMNRHAEALRQEQERQKEQMKKLKDEYEKTILDIRAQLKDTNSVGEGLRSTIVQLEERITTLEAELKAAQSALEKAAMQEKDMIEKYEKMLSSNTQQMMEMEESLNAKLITEREVHAEKIKTLEEELSSLRMHLRADVEASERLWENKNKTQAENFERLLQKLRQEHDEKIRQLTEFYDSTAAKMDASRLEEIRNLIESNKRRQEEDRLKFEKAKKEFAEELRRRDEELQKSQGRIDAMSLNVKEESDRLNEEIRAQKESFEKLTTNYEDLQGENQKVNAELHLLRSGYSKLEKKLWASEGRERELRESLANLEETSSRSRQEVEMLHRDYVAHMDRRHAEKMQAALDELRATMTAERNELQQQADAALASMQQKYLDSQKEVNSLNLELTAAREDIKKCKQELEEEQKDRVLANREFHATMEAMRSEFELEREKQRLFAENHLNEIATKHKWIMEDLMQQHQREQTSQNDVIRELQAALDELRYRYEYRESRAEDVALINRLMKEGQQKDQELKKAINDMKMYKLELINREENYNKVFGRRPLVASTTSADKAPRLQPEARERGNHYERRIS